MQPNFTVKGVGRVFPWPFSPPWYFHGLVFYFLSHSQCSNRFLRRIRHKLAVYSHDVGVGDAKAWLIEPRCKHVTDHYIPSYIYRPDLEFGGSDDNSLVKRKEIVNVTWTSTFREMLFCHLSKDAMLETTALHIHQQPAPPVILLPEKSTERQERQPNVFGFLP